MMTGSKTVALALLVAAGTTTWPARAETVFEPGHRTWANQWVPPHYETRPDTRYVAPRNQPLESVVSPSTVPADPHAPAPRNQTLESMIASQNGKPSAAAPPVSVYAPAPQYDPYYNALNAASRPMHTPLKLRSGEPR